MEETQFCQVPWLLSLTSPSVSPSLSTHVERGIGTSAGEARAILASKSRSTCNLPRPISYSFLFLFCFNDVQEFNHIDFLPQTLAQSKLLFLYRPAVHLMYTYIHPHPRNRELLSLPVSVSVCLSVSLSLSSLSPSLYVFFPFFCVFLSFSLSSSPCMFFFFSLPVSLPTYFC